MKERYILEASKKRGSKPNYMPEPTSNVIKPSRIPKQRQPKGRQDTRFQGRPSSRGDQQRRALEDQ